MEDALRKRGAGLTAFFFSGICAISTGVIVSLLQDQHGFDYGVTGTLLSLMNIGNLAAGFMAGLLPGRIGMKKSVTLLTVGYAAGYIIMGVTGWVTLLMLAFFLLGIAKGSTINTCTILVGDYSKDRTVGMNLMHACYACGALLCPFFIAAAAKIGAAAPMLALAACGAALWLVFFVTPMDGIAGKKGGSGTDWSFLKSRKFWLLVGLIFCQNAAETGVTSWMVSYFKGSGIISGTVSAYTVTVMWAATLIARLLIAFVVPLKKPAKAMIVMSLGCIVFYVGLMLSHTQLPAIAILFCFAFSMAGMNPTAVSLAGRMTNVTSIGVLLPAASSGAIIMPWVIGAAADRYGISTGMATNIAPCVGLLVFSVLVSRLPGEEG